MTFSCPSCEGDLRFATKFHEGCREQGESGYSLGQPAEDSCVEVIADSDCPHCNHEFTDEEIQRFEEQAAERYADRAEDGE